MVTVFGTEADVSAISGENIILVADLSDYSSALGSYAIPAEVEINSGVTSASRESTRSR